MTLLLTNISGVGSGVGKALYPVYCSGTEVTGGDGLVGEVVFLFVSRYIQSGPVTGQSSIRPYSQAFLHTIMKQSYIPGGSRTGYSETSFIYILFAFYRIELQLSKWRRVNFTKETWCKIMLQYDHMKSKTANYNTILPFLCMEAVPKSGLSTGMADLRIWMAEMRFFMGSLLQIPLWKTGQYSPDPFPDICFISMW